MRAGKTGGKKSRQKLSLTNAGRIKESMEQSKRKGSRNESKQTRNEAYKKASKPNSSTQDRKQVIKLIAKHESERTRLLWRRSKTSK